MMRTTIPDMASVLMIGSPGIGLLEFNIGLVKEYLDNDELVIFVSMDLTPTDLLSLMGEFAIPTKEVLGKNLFIIDFHSSLLGNAEDSPIFDKGSVILVSDIEGIMFNVAAIVKDRKRPVRIFIYALSTMFLYNQVNVVLKFFQIS
ncbi:MAG: hypothetical protein LLG16_03685, partial [Euryarchaeota archaeon]|nr:hypothetical protein [Euryarchaeota archaeon]